MIDYEKLEEAHHICVGTDFYVSAEFGHLGGVFIYILNKSQSNRLFETKDLSDLITKLRELTKPKPKYAVDDIVWRLNDEDGVTKCRVLKDNIEIYGQSQCKDDEYEAAWWTEEQLYPTRRAAIESQLWHWRRMLADEMHKPNASCCSVHTGGHEECARPEDTHKEPEECMHEAVHGWFMTGPEPGHGFIHKCKKCGEFYR